MKTKPSNQTLQLNSHIIRFNHVQPLRTGFNKIHSSFKSTKKRKKSRSNNEQTFVSQLIEAYNISFFLIRKKKLFNRYFR